MKTKDNQEDFEEKSVLETIESCGKLKFSIAQIVSLLRSRLSDHERSALVIALKTESSEEYQAYQTGYVTGEYEMQMAFRDQAVSGGKEAKNGYDSLTRERRKEIIDKALRDRFGLEVQE